MNIFKKIKLAIKLRLDGEIGFEYNGNHYNIYESELNNGFMVDIFTPTGDEPIDGGLCTGNEWNAIGLML
jgi:hypothetical protein